MPERPDVGDLFQYFEFAIQKPSIKTKSQNAKGKKIATHNSSLLSCIGLSDTELCFIVQ